MQRQTFQPVSSVEWQASVDRAGIVTGQDRVADFARHALTRRSRCCNLSCAQSYGFILLLGLKRTPDRTHAVVANLMRAMRWVARDPSPNAVHLLRTSCRRM